MPLSQREICSARSCTETLCSTSDDDGDSHAWPAFQDVYTALLAHTADAHSHDYVSVERNTEIGGQCEEVSNNSWIGFGEPSCLRAEDCLRAHANDTVWMVPKDVWAVWG